MAYSNDNDPRRALDSYRSSGGHGLPPIYVPAPGSSLGKRSTAELSPTLPRDNDRYASRSSSFSSYTPPEIAYDRLPPPSLRDPYDLAAPSLPMPYASSSYMSSFTPSSYSSGGNSSLAGGAPSSLSSYSPYAAMSAPRRLSMGSNGGAPSLPPAPFAGELSAPSSHASRKPRRRLPNSLCHVCGVEETPEWRRGPAGTRTLCNACGLSLSKLPAFPAAQSHDELVSQLTAIGKNRFRNPSFQLPASAADAADAAWCSSAPSSMTAPASSSRYSSMPSFEDAYRRKAPPPPIVTAGLPKPGKGPGSGRGETDFEAAFALQALSAGSPTSGRSSSSDSPTSGRLRDFALNQDPYYPAVSSTERHFSDMSLRDAGEGEVLGPLGLPLRHGAVNKMSLAHITSDEPISPNATRRFHFGGLTSSSSLSEADMTSQSSGSRPVTPGSGRKFSFGLKK